LNSSLRRRRKLRCSELNRETIVIVEQNISLLSEERLSAAKMRRGERMRRERPGKTTKKRERCERGEGRRGKEAKEHHVFFIHYRKRRREESRESFQRYHNTRHCAYNLFSFSSPSSFSSNSFFFIHHFSFFYRLLLVGSGLIEISKKGIELTRKLGLNERRRTIALRQNLIR